MKKATATLALLLVIALAFSFTACGGDSSSEKTNAEVETKEEKKVEKKEDTEKKKIAFSVFTMQHNFFQQMEKGTKEAIESLGYEYIFHDQKADETLMVSGCQDLLNQDIAALVISPCRPESLGPIVEAAHKKDIPVVVDDIGGGGSNYDVIVVSDNEGGGKMAAEWYVKEYEPTSKKAALITVDPSFTYAMRRTEGFKKAITAAGYEVVKELSAHDHQEEAYTVMTDIINSSPDVEVVFCGCEPMAVGAAQACIDANRDDINVIGFDANEMILNAIEDGTMEATIQQVPYKMGKMSVELADKLINGEDLEFDNEDQREVHAPVNLITKENVDEALAEIK